MQNYLIQIQQGLFVIGTVRHDSRRIDNQLRGRSGRQGDVGCSKFFLSLDDNLIKFFTSEKSVNFLKNHLKGLDSLNHPLANRAIASAQKRIENQYYESRQHLLKFDNVVNEQRQLIYNKRDQILIAHPTKFTFLDTVDDVVELIISQIAPDGDSLDSEHLKQLVSKCKLIFNIDITDKLPNDFINSSVSINIIHSAVEESYLTKELQYGEDIMLEAIKYIQIATLDQAWREHIAALGIVKEAIQNRAYGQKDPLNEYKKEAFELFETMLDKFNYLFVQRVSHFAIVPDAPQNNDQMTNIRRNDLCPCKSGKKYKHCHGASS